MSQFTPRNRRIAAAAGVGVMVAALAAPGLAGAAGGQSAGTAGGGSTKAPVTAKAAAGKRDVRGPGDHRDRGKRDVRGPGDHRDHGKRDVRGPGDPRDR